MRWTVLEAAAATGGELSAPGPPGGPGRDAGVAVIESVAIDSRRLAPGSLFVAVRAERDGHQFVPAAAQSGAVAALVDRRWVRPDGFALPAIVVDDTLDALTGLGRAARSRLAGEVVGVTGSVGKTSTKDLAAAALAAGVATTASERSFNNELGVPLTLANAPEGTRVAVVEMGARGPGHIRNLCAVARPTVGVVTAVAAAHTETFGSLEGVARAKGELVEALPADGSAVLNADDPRVAAMAGRTAASVITYSALGAAGADVVAERVELGEDLRARFVVRSPWGAAEVRLEARGGHQVANALAAVVVAVRCGVAVEAACAALGSAPMSPWRMELHRTGSGVTVLNDAYNANPASMAAALRALAVLPARRRVAVLGEMAELGPRAGDEHRAIAELAERLGVVMFAVATGAYGVPPLADVDVAAATLAGILQPGDAVLVKASRVAGLERIAALLGA
jgi:UDP-N-acetylmuramoyl-tripeptide--D-alanyl-D-alanine ligase